MSMNVLGLPELRFDMPDEEMDAVVAAATRFVAYTSITETSMRYPHSMLQDALRAEFNLPRDGPGTHAYRSLGQFVVKTVTDCNLRCVYPCYEYVDNTWEDLPPVMPDEVVAQLGRRAGEYAVSEALKKVTFVFHGGEPLYMKSPETYYDRIIPLLLENALQVAPELKVELRMQTNGMLLRRPILDVLKKHKVGVTVSLDGDAEAHDARRVTKRSAKGSHKLVMSGLNLLRSPEYAELYRGLLCVVNVDADPLKVYRYLSSLNPPNLDFLLPYGTHDNPPPPPEGPLRDSPTPYADWLLTVFWRWFARPSDINIRLFRSIMSMSVGGKNYTEAIGPDTGGEVVIRTDGSLEELDALKMGGEGVVATGMNIQTHSFEEVAEHLRRSHQLGKKTVATACKDCDFLAICGGGHMANRYSAERGFDNPSIYSADLKRLISEIRLATYYISSVVMESILHERGVPVPSHHECDAC